MLCTILKVGIQLPVTNLIGIVVRLLELLRETSELVRDLLIERLGHGTALQESAQLLRGAGGGEVFGFGDRAIFESIHCNALYVIFN